MVVWQIVDHGYAFVVDLFPSSVDQFPSSVDLFPSFVDLFPSFVDLFPFFVDLFPSFVDQLPDQPQPSVDPSTHRHSTQLNTQSVKFRVCIDR